MQLGTHKFAQTVTEDGGAARRGVLLCCFRSGAGCIPHERLQTSVDPKRFVFIMET